MFAARERAFSAENLNKIQRDAIEACEAQDGFSKLSFDEQKQLFWNYINLSLEKAWRNEFIAKADLKGQEDLLFRNDNSDFSKLRKDRPDFISFNEGMITLLAIAGWLINLFWLVVIALVVLFVFIIRSNQIIQSGSEQNIKNRIIKG